MLSRRNLRVKTMQCIYAFKHDESMDVESLRKTIPWTLRKVYLLYLYQLYVFYRVVDYVHTDADVRTSRLLKTEEDNNLSTKIAENRIIGFLRKKLVPIAESEKFHEWIDNNVIRELYLELRESEAFTIYDNTPVPDYNEDRTFGKAVYSIMIGDVRYIDHINDLFSNWEDDDEVTGQGVLEFLNNSEAKLALADEELKRNETFCLEIISKFVENESSLEELIAPKLNNWDMERVSHLDLILLMMALTEIIYCPTIPVKVSINEYIEIAKMYSSPKSGDFVNGVLDKTMRDLKKEGKIVKTGRGLKE